ERAAEIALRVFVAFELEAGAEKLRGAFFVAGHEAADSEPLEVLGLAARADHFGERLDGGAERVDLRGRRLVRRNFDVRDELDRLSLLFHRIRPEGRA